MTFYNKIYKELLFIIYCIKQIFKKTLEKIIYDNYNNNYKILLLLFSMFHRIVLYDCCNHFENIFFYSYYLINNFSKYIFLDFFYASDHALDINKFDNYYCIVYLFFITK